MVYTDNPALCRQLSQLTDENEILDMVVGYMARVNDQKQVLRFAREWSDDFNRADLINRLNFGLRKETSRISMLKTMLTAFLKQHTAMHVEGFLRFRMQEYNQCLERILRHITDIYRSEKEYEAFVEILTCLLEEQESQYAEVHLFAENPDAYYLLDEHMQLLFAVEGAHLPMRGEEVLLHLLVILAPRWVILHSKRGWEAQNTFRTIGLVFGERFFCFEDNTRDFE